MKNSRFLLAAGILLAMAFTFSACSGDADGGDNNNNNGNSNNSGNNNNGNNSSNSNGNAFVNCEVYGYCFGVYEDDPFTRDECLFGGGKVVSSCESSSSSSSTPNTPSSSSNTKCGTLDYNPSTQICYYNQIYNYVTIGTQIWMKENLNVSHMWSSGWKCYDDLEANCDKYGKLYNWATAMNFEIPYISACNTMSCASRIQSKHRGICPEGWHIPSRAEWNTLVTYVGANTRTKLKAKSPNWNGTDLYSFSALPGGAHSGPTPPGDGVPYFVGVGIMASWWTTTEGYYNDWACEQTLTDQTLTDDDYDDGIYDGCQSQKNSHVSVRCVRD